MLQRDDIAKGHSGAPEAIPIKIPKNHPSSFQIHPPDSTVPATARVRPFPSGSPLGVIFGPKLKIYVKIK